MYYAEKVIDGVLHYKTSPDGEWIKMSDVDLTSKFREEQTRRVLLEGVAETFLAYLEDGSAGDVLCDLEDCTCRDDYIKELKELLRHKI